MCSSRICWWPEGLEVENEDSTSQYQQVHSVRWFPVTPILNIDILALFSQVAIVDIHGRSKQSGWCGFGRTSFHGHFRTAHAHVACVLVQHNGC